MPKSQPETFPAALASLMIEHKFDVRELSLESYYTEQTIYKWLAGETQPRYPAIVRLGEVFQLSDADFEALAKTAGFAPGNRPRWRGHGVAQGEVIWAHEALRELNQLLPLLDDRARVHVEEMISRTLRRAKKGLGTKHIEELESIISP